MRGLRRVAEAEVVLAFLAGELDSPRFGAATRAALDTVGGLPLVTMPDLKSAAQNEAREQALGKARGWGTDSGLFEGFPADISWTHGQLTAKELRSARFINYSYWNELSGGSRRPADVATVLSRGSIPPWAVELGTDWLDDLAGALRAGARIGDLIVVTTPRKQELVLLEGHARLAALFVAELADEMPVTAYMGVAEDMRSWTLF